MLGTAFYLIRPNNNLMSRLDSHSEDWAELLRQPALWSRHESGEIAIPIGEWKLLRILQVKVLFILDLKAEYCTNDSSQPRDFGDFLLSLVGSESITPEKFDRWWNIERIDSLDSTFEQVEADVNNVQANLIRLPPISGGKEWIDSLLIGHRK